MTAFHADLGLARRFSAALDRILVDHVGVVAKLRPESGAMALPVADGFALYCGQGTDPSANRVTGLGMHGPVTAEHFDAMEAFYAERNMPCVIALYPFADASVTYQAAARGYMLHMFRNVLARPVDAASIGAPDRDPLADAAAAGIVVERARADEAELWARVVGSGFAEKELDAPAFGRLVAFHCPDTVCYFGRIDGEEAGGGAMTIKDGFAYIWEVATRPSFRRRGVQQAIYHTLVQDAARAGCDTVALGTEVGHVSQRNAERAGFRLIFTGAALVRQLPGASSVRVK